MSQEAVCPGIRPSFGDRQSDHGYLPFWSLQTSQRTVCLPSSSFRPPSTRTPLTHTVHMPVMENADRLTGRRIQAVMREWSQGGGSLGVRTTGRWGRGDRPSYLEIFRPQSSAALAWWGRKIKVQGLATGQGGGRGGVGNTSSQSSPWAFRRPDFGLSLSRNVAPSGYPSGASAIYSNATGALRASGRAVTSGKRATLPGLRDTGLVKAGARTIKAIMPRKAWEGAPGRESGCEALACGQTT